MLLRLGVVGTPLLIAILGTGCQSWREPRYSPLISAFRLDPGGWPLATGSASTRTAAYGTGDAALAEARDFAADAGLAELAGSADSTDAHCQTALASWTALAASAPGTETFQAAWDAYHTSVTRLVTTAREGGRFVAGQGVTVNSAGGQAIVPLVVYSSVWRREDVQAVHAVGEYRVSSLSRQYVTSGWGVPVVVERRCPTGTRVEEEFINPGTMFAATALVRPCAIGGATLELFDLLHPAPGGAPPVTPLARDLTAPFALRITCSPQLRRDWLAFFGVDTPTRDGLFFIEPYQPGKIPVVLVHGLLSDPLALVDMTNDLRAVPGFADRFQLWGFRYSTEEPFLESASLLRRDLYRAYATIDPAGQDPALGQTVLVGHSMGGLICELQAASSQDRLWTAVSTRPFHTIVATYEARRSLADMFFFNPQPNVRCVISVAAPHRGSSWAVRPIGRLGAALAQPDAERTARHEQLVRDNPGAFSEEVVNRVPTSIDMLNPNSAILAAIGSLPTNPCVEYHTIVGYGRTNLFEGEGDGIVALESALSPRAGRQTGVDASHVTIHRRMESVSEIVQILNERWAKYCGELSLMAMPVAPEFDLVPSMAAQVN
jgi:pimeloyl-ACP methyl ester carboxylesterase